MKRKITLTECVDILYRQNIQKQEIGKFLNLTTKKTGKYNPSLLGQLCNGQRKSFNKVTCNDMVGMLYAKQKYKIHIDEYLTTKENQKKPIRHFDPGVYPTWHLIGSWNNETDDEVVTLHFSNDGFCSFEILYKKLGAEPFSLNKTPNKYSPISFEIFNENLIFFLLTFDNRFSIYCSFTNSTSPSHLWMALAGIDWVTGTPYSFTKELKKIS